jgi:hypothetical protein
MKLGRLIIAGALWLAGTTMAAHAQSPEETRAALPGLVRDAFDTPYGKALVAELGKSLRNNADPACLSAKGIAPDQLEPRGRDLIVNWGLRMMETTNSFIDSKAYNEKFAASAGRGAAAELARLRNDANVKRGLELQQPIRLAKIADSIFEQFDRYVLITKIKLATVSPLGTGNNELLEMNPTEAAEEQLDKYIAANKSPALKKYLALSEKSLAVSTAATKIEDAWKVGPHTFFGGVETELAELCIVSKR